LTGIIQFWLDEEWTPLPVHAHIGQAAGQAYGKVRQEGATDMADLVLSLSAELQGTDFGDAFIGPFDVSNKIVELLMQRSGIDVCCTNEDDLIGRYNAESGA
jgi:hypothetical protein